MERVAVHRQVLRQILDEEAGRLPALGEVEALRSYDEVRDQYQVLYVGWNGNQRIFLVLCYLRLCAGKIWVECDGTSDGIATRLVAAGVPQDEIVLAFHPAWKRPLTTFAVA